MPAIPDTSYDYFWNRSDYAEKNLSTVTFKYKGNHVKEGEPPNRVITFQENAENRIGKGGFGTVYQAQTNTINYHTKTLTFKRKRKLVKVIYNVDVEHKARIMAEYDYGKKVKHLGMKEPVFIGDEGNQTCYLVMTHLPGCDLSSLIKTKAIDTLSDDERVELTYKLLLALRYQVTILNLLHRDIKPENIKVVLYPEIEVYIIDYGMATNSGPTNYYNSGTYGYLAPERLNPHSTHDTPSDVYSMGKVLARLWLKRYIPKQNEDYQAVLNFCDIQLKKNVAIHSLLKGILAIKPEQRMTVDDSIKHLESHFPHIMYQKNHRNQVKKIKLNLNQLASYAKTIKQTHTSDHNTIMACHDKMNQCITNPENTKTINKLIAECQTILHDKALTSCVNNHKKTDYILKNIAAAALGLGLFYVVACGINYSLNGRTTFFHSRVSTAHFNLSNELKTISPAA